MLNTGFSLVWIPKDSDGSLAISVLHSTMPSIGERGVIEEK
jgi:hypothetical protein